MKKIIVKVLDQTLIVVYDEHFHSLKTIQTIIRNETKKLTQKEQSKLL